MRRIAQVNFKGHSVHIDWDQDSERILCFKHDQNRCDYEVFTIDQEEEAAEWIITALPLGEWRFEEADQTQ